MSDAPMSASEFAEELYISLGPHKPGKGWKLVHAKRVITEYVASIRRVAQSDSLTCATHVLQILFEGKPGAAQNAVREDYPKLASMVDAYRERIVAQARLDQHCADLGGTNHVCTGCVKLRADLARLAADAEKEGK